MSAFRGRADIDQPASIQTNAARAASGTKNRNQTFWIESGNFVKEVPPRTQDKLIHS
jgi:hypothetical protein